MNVLSGETLEVAPLLEWVGCATGLLFAGLLLAAALRNWSAAGRHRLWLLTFLGLWLLPLALLVLPTLHIPIPVPVLQPNKTTKPSAHATGQAPDPVRPGLATSPNTDSNFTETARSDGGLPSTVGFHDTEDPSTAHKLTSVQNTVINTRSADNIETTLFSDHTRRQTVQWLVVVWILGIAITVSPFLSGLLSSRLIKASSRKVADPRIEKFKREICKRLNIRARVAVLRFNQPLVPMTCGIWRPCIILPVTCHEWTDQRLIAVLTHELAHISRRDVAAQAIARLACSIYWFHPLAWFGLYRMRLEREMACDDCVVVSGQKPSDYAHQLVQLAGTHSRVHVNCGVAMAAASDLEMRLAALFDVARSHLPLSQTASRAMLVGLLVVTTGLASVRPGNRSVGPMSPIAKTAEQLSSSSKQRRVVQSDVVQIAGIVSDSEGQPIEGASVAILVRETHPHHAGVVKNQDSFLAGSQTSATGAFNLVVPGVTSGQYRGVWVVAKKNGMAIGLQEIDSTADVVDVNLRLERQQLIFGKLLDSKGLPAAGVTLHVGTIIKYSTDIRKEFFHYDGEPSSEFWFSPITSNADGSFQVPGIAPDYGVGISIKDSDRFAQQQIYLNTGTSETREGNDSTYRGIVRNVAAGEVATVTLGNAQIFEGTVTTADTGEAIPFAHVVVFASEQEHGSAVGVASQCDDEGRYRINPLRGPWFRVTAYAPPNYPYLSRVVDQIKWTGDETKRTLDLALPRGVLVRGKVVDGLRKLPVSNATVQYQPEVANNPHVRNDVETGWQNTQVTDAHGNFQITVFPGPGHILVKSNGDFSQKVIGLNMIRAGESGGAARYPDAHVKINPALEAAELDLKSINLMPGKTVNGSFVDESGAPVNNVKLVSTLITSPTEMAWRGYGAPDPGSRFQLQGVADGFQYSVTALNPERQIGATFTVTGEEEPVITLKPFGQATIRFVDIAGEPITEFPAALLLSVEQRVELATGRPDVMGLDSDENYASNIDPLNHKVSPKSGEDGRVRLPALVPGATYRVWVDISGKSQMVKEFRVESGQNLDLGTIKINEDSAERPFESIQE